MMKPVFDSWRGQNKPEGVRAFIGWNGLTVWDDDVSIADLLRAYIEKAAGESCGQCFPCRTGLKKMAAILGRCAAGKASDADLAELERLAKLVKSTARCDIGQTSPQPVLDVLEQDRAALGKAAAKPGDYVATVTAPCRNACPSHVDIPRYVEETRYRRFDKAFSCVMEDCPMPGTIGRVCVRPCEEACRRALVDEPIAIKHLKRFLADNDVKNGLPEAENPATGKPQVAIVGAGPAGLSCAYYLARRGITSTIFETQEDAGGMARFGIPDYRLPPKALAEEVERVRRMGCEIKYGVNVGKDVTVQDLEKQGYKSVFIGAGAPETSAMRCEGEDEGYEGFMPGIGFLAEAVRGRRALEGTKVLVIGGGNVAMDCVRTAKRLGFTDVQLLYRRTLAEMPADHVEIEEAQEEGVVFNYLIAPLKILAENGKVRALLCQKMELGPPDASGRSRPVPVEGSEFEIETDAIIPAIGQAAAVHMVLPDDDGLLTKWHTLVADDQTGRAGESDVLFGGGDCVTGPDTLIAALAAGKRAAQHMAAELSGMPVQATDTQKLEKLISTIGVFNKNEKWAYHGGSKKMRLQAMDPEERIKSFVEVEKGACEAEAVAEASRCLRCYRVAMAAL